MVGERGCLCLAQLICNPSLPVAGSSHWLRDDNVLELLEPVKIIAEERPYTSVPASARAASRPAEVTPKRADAIVDSSSVWTCSTCAELFHDPCTDVWRYRLSTHRAADLCDPRVTDPRPQHTN